MKRSFRQAAQRRQLGQGMKLSLIPNCPGATSPPAASAAAGADLPLSQATGGPVNSFTAGAVALPSALSSVLNRDQIAECLTGDIYKMTSHVLYMNRPTFSFQSQSRSSLLHRSSKSAIDLYATCSGASRFPHATASVGVRTIRLVGELQSVRLGLACSA